MKLPPLSSQSTGQLCTLFNKMNPNLISTKIFVIKEIGLMILAMIFYVIANILTAVLFFAIDYLLNNNSAKLHTSATSIQKCFRGYITRKAYLPVNLFTRYVSECKICAGPSSLSIERAPDGNTPVFLPPNLPEAILKKSGTKQAIKRFHQMQWVRAVLREQNSSHLIIPKARLCGEFLVEQRLPIITNLLDNNNLYLANSELFDKAVIELVRFFSRAYLGDLVGYFPNHPLCNTSAGKHLLVRYDNIPLYIAEENGEKKGKIGLIDLEYTQKIPDPNGLTTLVRIFPLHFNIIKTEVKKLGLDWDDKHLLALSKKRIKYMHEIRQRAS